MEIAIEQFARTRNCLAGSISPEELRRRLFTLPQELHDAVYDLVFTAQPGERVITPTTKPPSELQVSRATRAKYAQSYYGNGSSFCFPHYIYDADWPNADDYFTYWARCVDKQHKPMIAKLTVIRNTPSEKDVWQRELEFIRSGLIHEFGHRAYAADNLAVLADKIYMKSAQEVKAWEEDWYYSHYPDVDSDLESDGET